MLISVNPYFDKTILGDLIFRVNSDVRISSAHKWPSNNEFFHIGTPITKIVDIKTFKISHTEGATTYYEDKSYCYVLHFGEEIYLDYYEKDEIK